MQAVKAEPYQPKTWLDQKQDQLAGLDRTIQEMKAWLASAKKHAYVNIPADQLGETIKKLFYLEVQRKHLRHAVVKVQNLQQEIERIQKFA